MCGDSESPLALASEPSSANPYGVAVSHQALGFCQSFDRVGETKESVSADGLHADAFHKVGRRKPGSVACPTPRWEDVIAAASGVAKRLRPPRAVEGGGRRAIP